METISVVAINYCDEQFVSEVARLLPQLSTTAVPPDRDTLQRIVDSHATTLIAARDQQGRLVGILTLALFEIPTGIRAWIEDVVVDSAARGLGVGEAMTRFAIKEAQHSGAKTIDLTSRSTRVAAHRLYEKVGFIPRDTTVYRYQPPSGA